MRRIYLDYASLPPIDPRVWREVNKYSAHEFANPSSIYKEGVEAKKALLSARRCAAAFIHGHDDEIYFTSGGTEANALALEGAARAFIHGGNVKPHLIISAIEHSSTIETARMMEKQGMEVTVLPVNKSGFISLEDLKKAIKPNTYLVSIMFVNNEIGAVQPIKEIAKVIRHSRSITNNQDPITNNQKPTSNYPLFHTDASQAALYHDLNMEKLGVDMMTLDGGKICGPRGIGALYVRRGTPIEPIIYGGGQESRDAVGRRKYSGYHGLCQSSRFGGAGKGKRSRTALGIEENVYRRTQKNNPAGNDHWRRSFTGLF